MKAARELSRRSRRFHRRRSALPPSSSSPSRRLIRSAAVTNSPRTPVFFSDIDVADLRATRLATGRQTEDILYPGARGYFNFSIAIKTSTYSRVTRAHSSRPVRIHFDVLRNIMSALHRQDRSRVAAGGGGRGRREGGLISPCRGRSPGGKGARANVKTLVRGRASKYILVTDKISSAREIY